MAGFSIPGPAGTGDIAVIDVDDGTQPLCAMSLAAPLCAIREDGLPNAFWLSQLVGPDPIPSLFNSCLNPAQGLTDADFEQAATTLGIEVAMIKAVAQVEAPRGAFDDMGRPTILFERHYFHRFTAGAYDQSDPDISNPVDGGYGKFSAQYPKLERAYKLDAAAALKSCSWGKFQIMGANHEACGFGNVEYFVRAMMTSERGQLDAFVAFLTNTSGLIGKISKQDWAGFARSYNGPGYKKNDYDGKLKEAYEGFKAATK
jgi:N-acetylmuramidase